MQNYNLHTHSTYSDGKSSPSDIVEEALRQGFQAIGFSEHGPLPFPTCFAIPYEKMQSYVNEIRDLQNKNHGAIDVLCALEMDYITNCTDNFAETKAKYGLDYIIGGLHLVGQSNDPDTLWFTDGPDYKTYDQGLERFFDNDIRRAVRRFYDQTNEMIMNEQFDIIAHFDKIKMHNRDRFFHEDEQWYRDMVLETLDLIRQKGLIMEVNTRGIYKKRCDSLFPSPWILEKAYTMKIPAIISTDAHHYSEISYCFEEASTALKLAGYKSIVAPINRSWVEAAL